jgi:hypothetical protein
MNYLFIINPIFAVYNFITENTTKAWSTTLAVYRLCTTTPVWYITENGQFANSSDMNIFEKSICWAYDGSVIYNIESCNLRKLPYLSFEFKYSDIIINMDDFIENTKFRANEPPPLSVIMAAFCINTKVLYPWQKGHFNVFSKMGDQIEFSGADGKFPSNQ